MVTRRAFLTAVSSAYVASAFAREAAAASMKLGYAAITWGPDIDKAMEDISAVGFKAIQLRGEAFAQYGDRPKDLVARLEKNKLTFAVLSSGNLSIDPAREQEMLALHVQHAKFVRAAGGKCLQIIDERPKGRDGRGRRLPAPWPSVDGARETDGRPRRADGVPPPHEQHRRKAAGAAGRPRLRGPAVRADAVRRGALPAGRRRSGSGDPRVPRLDRRGSPEGRREPRRPGRRRTSSSSWGVGAWIFRPCLPPCATSRSTSGRSSSSIASPIPAGRRRSRRR